MQKSEMNKYKNISTEKLQKYSYEHRVNFKTFNSEFLYNEVWFTDQNSRH